MSRTSTSRTSTSRTRLARAASRTARLAVVGAAGLGLALLAPAAASAHVHVSPGAADAGETVELGFAVGHGCDGSPTTGLRIAVPEEVSALTPIANAGWTVEAFAEGAERGVALTALTPLPDGVRDTIALEVTIGEDVADGTVLAFPVEQTCASGASYDWAGPADGEEPAPELVVGGDPAAGHGDHAEHGGTTGDDASTDDAAAAAAAAAPAATPASVDPISIAALVVGVIAAALAAIAIRRQAASRAGR
ncbi:DUF1775 domain-containing protein [Agrococcus sp. SL85]|uniref:DUF1775 domain-containing protein n=1 Tax=Agrococcus sp. SL85 TaxID=2995141 RepID=UPI00226CCD83|nr:DUF1775 domain-containing protein [Agrococcus sp. SL85]WAC65318.1 DUF1775 domain-containing protein [Agrococcus sp. SL85]